MFLGSDGVSVNTGIKKRTNNNRAPRNIEHRACGTRWINHKLLAFENMLEKYGLYMQHFENILVGTSKKKKKIKLHLKVNFTNSRKPKQ